MCKSASTVETWDMCSSHCGNISNFCGGTLGQARAWFTKVSHRLFVKACQVRQTQGGSWKSNQPMIPSESCFIAISIVNLGMSIATVWVICGEYSFLAWLDALIHSLGKVDITYSCGVQLPIVDVKACWSAPLLREQYGSALFHLCRLEYFHFHRFIHLWLLELACPAPNSYKAQNESVVIYLVLNRCRVFPGLSDVNVCLTMIQSRPSSRCVCCDVHRIWGLSWRIVYNHEPLQRYFHFITSMTFDFRLSILYFFLVYNTHLDCRL